MKNISLFTFCLAASCTLLGMNTSSHAATMVDTEISFLVDISGSVNSTEYDLQIDGYINAFNTLDFSGANFAANFIVWSGSSQQQQSVGWTQINDNTSAQAFANAIQNALKPETTKRPFAGATAPGSAINFAVPLFGTETGGIDNGFTSQRQIIDISGDGRSNSGANTATARDNALTAGIDAINGLPILTDDPNLDDWYQNNIVAGTGSFLEVANDFNDFSAAIAKKISREVGTPTTTPEPNALVALFGVVVFGAKSMLKKNDKNTLVVERKG